ncbi:uncharacterized protein LOC117784191 [Drosophila innubila]|uniref:uncharacterized protein LOC117784191 n=1 Tax=Drosophila innubila TaxID=198719 RepID=UPI00148BC501|nr:uncharacterized protein LOC117784191 [Drosophila innubila]
MHRSCLFLKSLNPVNIYKSASAIYMTSVAKIAPSALNPTCTTELATEESIVQALHESISPNAQKVEYQAAENNLDKEQEQQLQSEQDDDFVYDEEGNVIMSSKESCNCVSSDNQEEDSEDNEEYLYDDDEEEDLLMTSTDRSLLLQSNYEKIYKHYKDTQPKPIPIQPKPHLTTCITFHDKLVLVFCMISLCISAYVIIKDAIMNPFFNLW